MQKFSELNAARSPQAVQRIRLRLTTYRLRRQPYSQSTLPSEWPKAMAPVTEAFYSVRGVLLTLPWLLWLFITDVAISLLLPLKAFFPDFTYDASSIGAFTVWRWIQFLFETVNGAEITVSGDALPHGESAVVVANHVTWPDFYMIQKMAIGAGMLGRCRYFAKIQLRSVPFLGWGLWAMGMPMVSRNWLKDKRELDRVFSGIVDRRWPTCACSFVSAARSFPWPLPQLLGFHS